MERDLSRYLERLDATLRSHRSFEIEGRSILDRSKVGGLSEFRARLRYWDGSLLIVEEALIVRHFNIVKTRYVYHYQQSDGTLIFRYDSAPHHPELPTFPHHKHLGSGACRTARF